MARRRRSTSTSIRPVNRVQDVAIARPRVRSALQLLEDRRLFHPEQAFRPALSFGMIRQQRVVVRKANRRDTVVPSALAFPVPRKVAICQRRKERREVMIARGVGGSRAPKRRNYFSDIRCK